MNFATLTGLTISAFLLINHTALAQLTYKPPTNRKQQQQAQSATTRGCGKESAQLRVLAPSDRVAVTVSAEPTFLIYVSRKPNYPLEISLTRPYVTQTLWKSTQIIEREGIFRVTLPESLKLEENIDYILTAALPCALNNPDSSVFVRVVFQKISLSDKNRSQASSNLVGTQERQFDSKQGEFLAANGIWYDALFWSYKNSPSDFQSLLNQGGIQLNTGEKQQN
ncbi:MAG: DUF928 domain-containing protein [Microcystaceae cyanobacterium]